MPNRTDSNDGSNDSNDDRIEELIERERSPHRKPQVRITGLMVQYYHVCKRELWFMSRGIDIDRGAANIRPTVDVDSARHEPEFTLADVVVLHHESGDSHLRVTMGRPFPRNQFFDAVVLTVIRTTV